MSFPKFLLAGAVGASVLGASSPTSQAQNATTPTSSYTTVDANGNMVRSNQPDANTPGARATAGNAATGTASASSDRSRRGYGRGDKVRYEGGYYLPPNPYYPYPYPAPTYNNYYYPALPSTTVVSPPAFSWSRPTTVTNIPLGGSYSYPTTGYPTYPGYGYGVPTYSYPAPTYGYPGGYGVPGYGVPGYGFPAYGGVPYPAYGSTTTVFSNGTGSIYSQSQTGGYGFSLGQGGISIQLGNRQSSSSTTVRHY